MAGLKLWSTRDLHLEELLIEAVRKRRPLWDNCTPLHKNVRVLVYCWQQVAAEIGLSEQVLKKKWKGLRDYFFRQMKDFEKNGKIDKTGRDGKYCLWPLYDRLTFLQANKKNNVNFSNYKITTQEREILDKISEYDKQKWCNFETVVFVPPSPTEASIVENSTVTPVNLVENVPDPETTKQSQMQPLSKIKPISNTLQGKSIKQPETTNRLMLNEPPPLRVFKHAPNILLRKTESLIAKRPEPGQAPPAKKSKPTPEPDPKQPETVSDEESDADLHFFKSLLPFMRALPLTDKLRVRNGIQDLILGELDAIRARNDLIALEKQSKPSVDENRLIIPDIVGAEFDQESDLNRDVAIKLEFDEDESLLFEVDSKNLTFEGDDNYSED